ncbi:hypothetical protein MUK42_33538 [Musa troglodytarum]|uniref:Uncharacterized protein n=1 Tax=Musa troglodytarum TaxID=320322 RepID=A0A9E7I2Z8_9LILI|nr:hypothetical protein MUK42_33538 [Musa troglodytarum]
MLLLLSICFPAFKTDALRDRALRFASSELRPPEEIDDQRDGGGRWRRGERSVWRVGLQILMMSSSTSAQDAAITGELLPEPPGSRCCEFSSSVADSETPEHRHIGNVMLQQILSGG